MQNLMNKFVKDESGATAIEYGLIAALIAVAMIAGATAIGDQMNKKFDEVAGALESAASNKTTATNSGASTAS